MPKIFLSILTGLSSIILVRAQVEMNSEWHKSLFTQDSLLFNVGFNQCNVAIFEHVIDPDFEFYHDQSGIVSDKTSFIEGIKNGLCQLEYQPLRELDINSLEVFPLYDNGKFYGAIQNGRHSFYALYKDKPKQLTSVARFTHVWLLHETEWKLARGFSFDHQGR